MSDKDTASMTTVQMKPEYAASEVYSTTSEPPPAYKRQANSVKIAKIVAFTVIVSSFILGTFILSSSYLQARASCDQVQALDSVLEKELMLETLQQVNKELPRAEALLAKESIDDGELQNMEKPKPAPKPAKTEVDNRVEDSIEAENEFNKINAAAEEFPTPTNDKQLNPSPLNDVIYKFLSNTKKSKLNCVFERKTAEEIVNGQTKTIQIPFGGSIKTDPKETRLTGERISMFCDGDEDEENNNNNDDEEKTEKRKNNREEEEQNEVELTPPARRQILIPIRDFQIPYGAMPNEAPLTHMPQHAMPPVGMERQRFNMRPLPMEPQRLSVRPMPIEAQRFNFQPLSMEQQGPFNMQPVADEQPQRFNMPAPMPPQYQSLGMPLQRMQPPRVERVEPEAAQENVKPQTIRIQMHSIPISVQRIPIRAFPDLNTLLRGPTMDKILEGLYRSLNVDSSDSSDNGVSSSEEESARSESGSVSNEMDVNMPEQQQEKMQPRDMRAQQPQQQQQQVEERQPLPEQPRDTMTPPANEAPMRFSRLGSGRSLNHPVDLPVNYVEAEAQPQPQPRADPHPLSQQQLPLMSAAEIEPEESQRVHIMHPRSV